MRPLDLGRVHDARGAPAARTRVSILSPTFTTPPIPSQIELFKIHETKKTHPITAPPGKSNLGKLCSTPSVNALAPYANLSAEPLERRDRKCGWCFMRCGWVRISMGREGGEKGGRGWKEWYEEKDERRMRKRNG
jgi:hypothetical protein